MASLIEVNGVHPWIDADAWVAENVVISGDVNIGSGSSIWYGVVIRGDVNKIRIGKNVNIQDLTMVHGTKGRGDTLIGDNVSIGHRAIIHGCQIESKVLIGMGAIILDDVIVPSGCIIAAGALVTSGTHLESGYIYAGTPARKLKAVSPEQAQVYIEGTAAAYQQYREWYR
ncbi:MAG: gamma carbonic anhydrase family protein [Saprospiraceae bacterium]|nr:gamma carbonic anhydrase family protein [Saprospiraceae bacterium]